MSRDSVCNDGSFTNTRVCNSLQFTRFNTSRFGKSLRCTDCKRMDTLKFNSFNLLKFAKGLNGMPGCKRKCNVALPDTFKCSSEQLIPVCPIEPPYL